MIDTEHYGLHKPEENDYYNQDNENENMDAIDAALHELETGKETPKGAQEKADQAKAEAISACRPIVARTSGTGSAYEVTIDGVTELTIGMLITIIPHVSSSSTTPRLNVNSLGPKYIRRRYSDTNRSTTIGYTNAWLFSGVPQLLQYDGTYWIAVGANKPSASDLSDPVSVSKGGTGKASWSSYQLIYPSSSAALSQLAFPKTSGSFLRQGTGGAPYWTAPEDVREAIDAVPNTRTINGKPLSEDITLTAEDVDALPSSGGQISGNVRIMTDGAYPQISVQSTDESDDRIGIFEHSVDGRTVYFYNKSALSSNYTQLALYPEDTELRNLVRLLKRVDDGTSYYMMYGTHNVTVADSTPTEFVGEGAIVFCKSNHSIYRGINGANVRFY